MRHSLLFATLALAALSACGRYADFTLPVLRPAREIAYKVSDVSPPLLTRGAAGTWDSVDVLNPSVFAGHEAYYNLYSGFDGHTWRTGYALSLDGLRWVKLGPRLAPDRSTWEGDYIAANGSALIFQPRFILVSGREAAPHWCRGIIRRCLAKLANGACSTPAPAAVSMNEVWPTPMSSRSATSFICTISARVARDRQMIGVARSTDGVVWTKLRGNPVLEPGEPGQFDERGVGEPAVWTAFGWYWMLYTGRDHNEWRRIGLAKSRDGVHWEKLGVIFAGTAAWNRQVVCDPSVIEENGIVRVWYGGGDVPRPDEHIDGQIGLFTLTPQPALENAR